MFHRKTLPIKMKVGVFTFNYSANYGAILQCLSLYRTLRNLGAEADVIRYVPEGFRNYPPVWRGWGIKRGEFLMNIPQKWIAARHGPGMERAFDVFREKHLTFSDPCTTPDEIAAVAEGYDALITGSDQVWHFAQKPAFFLEWGKPYTGKRISYAPCCGHIEQPQERIGQIKEWVSRFDHISVRNDFTKEIIERLIGMPVPVVADPVLLTDVSDLQQKVDLPCSDYILMYTLGKEILGGHENVIRAIRHKVGIMPVVAVIPSAHKPHVAPWADIKIWEAGPAEWLYLIANAKFVYTDSFHGVLYALKFNRPFLAYYTEAGRAPRLIDLACRYKIGTSVVGSTREAAENIGSYKLDNMIVHEKLVAHRQFSLDYLKKSLSL